MQVLTNFISLWEYDPENGLHFTYSVKKSKTGPGLSEFDRQIPSSDQ